MMKIQTGLLKNRIRMLIQSILTIVITHANKMANGGKEYESARRFD